MKELLLIRHGQTNWNTQGRVQGGGDLNEVGITQSNALAAVLEKFHATAIYTSPSRRAHQTATIIATALSLPVYTTSLLKDLDYGVWSGALLADLIKNDPDLFERWEKDPSSVTFPEGGSLLDLRRRISTFMDEITEKHPYETVVLVTHESPIISMVAIALEIPDSSHRNFHADNASLTILESKNEHYILSTFNDTSHLNGIDEPLNI
jgi:broad specificity phosphatase PhoE